MMVVVVNGRVPRGSSANMELGPILVVEPEFHNGTFTGPSDMMMCNGRFRVHCTWNPNMVKILTFCALLKASGYHFTYCSCAGRRRHKEVR